MTDPYVKRLTRFLALGVGVVAMFPFLFGYLARPPGSTYLGVPFATDDAMVYAAWMRQAMDGRFLFDNRFAIEPQAGLTFHLYFLLLGWLAKPLGIPLAMTVGRVAFSVLFVFLASRLVQRFSEDPYTQKLGIVLSVFGGGVGFLCWHTFGVAFVRPSPLSPFFGGRLPIDVWQTEGFVFPSMLVNGLFMVSLCLILGVFLCVLDARTGWRPVGWGALWFAVLMNIHSYDVALIAMVLVGFLATVLANRTPHAGVWVLRVLVMVLGVIPAALWFLHVFRNDPVFQARAAVPTYAAPFAALIGGYVLLLALALYGFAKSPERRIVLGAGALAVAVAIGFGLSLGAGEGYWMPLGVWVLVFAAAVAMAVLLRGSSPGYNLVLCWALAGLAAPYFPTAVQRKFAFGLSIPWAMLAAAGLAALLAARERGVRNLVAVFGIAVLSGTSLQWFFRDLNLVKANVSNTTVHALYLTPNIKEILLALHQPKERRIVLAMPGIANPVGPDAFSTPYLPDLNAILSGFSGVYTYAGHWGETPDYNRRRSEATFFFLRASPEQRAAFLRDKKIDYLVAPVPEAFPDIAQINQGRALPDLSEHGDVIADGPQFRLIHVR